MVELKISYGPAHGFGTSHNINDKTVHPSKIDSNFKRETPCPPIWRKLYSLSTCLAVYHSEAFHETVGGLDALPAITTWMLNKQYHERC